MKYRKLGKTGIEVSEVGVGCSGLIGRDLDGMNRAVDIMEELGVNYLDLYSPNPDFRNFMGRAVINRRDKFVLQAHIGTIWKDDKYQYSRRLSDVEKGFSDQLRRLATGHVEIGMIHNVESPEDLDLILNGDVYKFAEKLKHIGSIRAIGVSCSDAHTTLLAARSGAFETIMFAANPYADHLGADGQITDVLDPEREQLYALCAEKEIGLTIMSAFNAGQLLDAVTSPTGVALTVEQCLGYALDTPGVSSVMCSAFNGEELRKACAYPDAPDTEKKYLDALKAFYGA